MGRRSTINHLAAGLAWLQSLARHLAAENLFDGQAKTVRQGHHRARILKGLLGTASVAGPTMSSLADTFGLEPLITKPLAIISDARIGARTDKSAITERLLSISSQDQMTVARKFKSAWDGQLMTRFMIITNDLPSMSDNSGALAGRYMILLLIKSFFGKEDPALTGKLLKELPGILNWAIAGYRRLRERGHFVQPKSSQEAADEIEMLAAPVKAFIRDRCQIGAGLSVEHNIISADNCTKRGRKLRAARLAPRLGSRSTCHPPSRV